MAAPMQRLAAALTKKRPGAAVQMFVVHQKPKTPTLTQALLPGVRALAWQDFVGQL